MVSRVTTATTIGLNAHKLDVEVDFVHSLPNISIVGLPDIAVNEAKERVRSAIKNSGFSFPALRVVINLAPADIRKEGTNFDLPIAIGILAENGIIEENELKNSAFLGELSLDGSLRSVNGVLPLVCGLKDCGVKSVIVPSANAKEAALVEGIEVLGANSLNDVVNHFSQNSEDKLTKTVVNINQYLKEHCLNNYIYDFKDVKGQQKAKKAMEIAAAGGHNILMSGSPGSGKTLMAKCFASILPPLELEEALELTKIYSISGLLPSNQPLITQRPFRAVHHSASAVGIIGGGSSPKPGEITLAHRGVLFLDEMVEFPRQVLEVLRQPLEDGEVVISRAQTSIKYPADFMLLGAMNPCPCGFLGDSQKNCTCSEFQIQRYRSRLSGPLLDRIDLQIEVPRLSPEELLNSKQQGEPSEKIRQRVVKARQIQVQRYKGLSILTNSQLNSDLIKTFCKIDETSENMLKSAIIKFNLSGRSYDRILKLARTIADLEEAKNISQSHIAQALQYRTFVVKEQAGIL
ncbi:MAG TPA: YifB family Mg chelatase-like AAA ATPase [Candidatus Gastranaerophilaceae bacterium]|nr:YifB family Mg chelatase-like AAA ATPase [Candidatus Gastranaerophilaceae bacterium]HPT41494.1 YifB family Mg chelatase-like AAA ATPase [Candidatus Gastranaerophilaceae bacterium]